MSTKILITSGGTKVPIDMVRSITNMSSGTFGSQIATQFLSHTDCKVIFLMAKNSKKPAIYSYNINFREYVTFDDYEKELNDILLNEKPNIIILAAAVSDYTVENYVNGKIRSGDDLVIRLKALPKLISQVRDKTDEKTVICGFKLLVNSTEEELKQASIKQLVDNKLDIVIGNDLRDIKNNDHTLTLVQRGDTKDSVDIIKHSKRVSDNLAYIVYRACVDTFNKKIVSL